MNKLIILAVILLMGSCESKRAANKIRWLKSKNYVTDSSTTKFIKGKDSLITDTTYLQSVLRDSIHTDSIIYIRETKTLIREVLKHRVDTIVKENNKTVYQKSDCNKKHWTILELIGFGFVCLIVGGILTLIFKR
jgi:UDP-N-acetylmuramoylalanine-D-glutamate ligase